MRTNAHSVASEEDDDDDQPIGNRLHIKTQQRKIPQHHRTEGETVTTNLPETTNQPTEMDDPEPKTPSTALVEYSGVEEYSTEFFDRHLDILSQQDLDSENLWADIERHYGSSPISIDLIRTIIPKGSSYRIPSPQRPSFSLGMMQLFKTPTPSPTRPIHPLLRGRKQPKLNWYKTTPSMFISTKQNLIKVANIKSTW
ncbi:hypothetical protein S245_066167 [Arachis hypogaea]